jgi:asparagine synthase (glutamine-hydrolysing)
MTLPGGRWTIVFNGEITNYIEIREELLAGGDTFVSEGDTEVLLKAWSRWGTATLNKLEGMFGLAVLDTVARTLTLARDGFGIKPLFYTASSDRVAFCSELSGLLELTGASPKLDWQTAVDYLQWGAYDHGPHTFIEGVSQLRPGHYAVVDVETGRVGEPVRYWSPSVETTFSGSYDDATEQVRSMFLASVQRNLRSDVPLGIALSGGLDSSAIVGAVRQIEPDLPINTFSFVAPGFARSEHEWIARVVEATGSRSQTIAASATDLQRDLDDLILSQGEPFGGTSIYAQYRVFKLAREHGVIVTLDGQGGDELFAGYNGYPAQRMHTLLETGRWAAASRFARNWGTWPGRNRAQMALETVAQFAPFQVRQTVRQPLASPLLDVGLLRERGIELRYPGSVAPLPARGARLKARLRAATTGYGLPSLLRHGDRNSMRFSIESRVPFLDRALTEFLWTLPEQWLIAENGTTKRILRDAVRGWIPDEVVDRRDKVGFETPESEWQQRLGAMPTDPEHSIGFLKPGRSDTLNGGLSEREIRWGGRSHWRLINLHRWVALAGVDAA